MEDRAINMTGKRFGKLTAIERAGLSRDGQALWRCVCECGKEVTVKGGNLRSSNTQSCGCLRAQRASEIGKATGPINGADNGRKSIWKRTGELSRRWLGDDIGYNSLHKWIEKFKPEACQRCKKATQHLDAHNVDGTYRRNLNDFVFLCKPCHGEVHRMLKATAPQSKPDFVSAA